MTSGLCTHCSPASSAAQTSYNSYSPPFQDAKSQHVVSGHISYLKQKRKNIYCTSAGWTFLCNKIEEYCQGCLVLLLEGHT